MKLVTIVGARPQFIKAASGSRALRKAHQEILVHTGQHHDENMSEVFFREMEIPAPDYNLGIAGGSHGEMTGKMLIEIEKVLLKERPDGVLLYGDTNSTLAGALAAVKLHIPVIHVEAGNRLGTMDSPEEVKKKVMGMYTDPDHLRVEDPGKIEGNTVFTYLDAFSRPEHFAKYLPDYASLDELKAHYRRGGLGDVKVKKFLYAILEELLAPIRERRRMYEQDIEGIYRILRLGSERARREAASTLADVRRAMRIDYFDDAELIARQAENYKNTK